MWLNTGLNTDSNIRIKVDNIISEQVIVSPPKVHQGHSESPIFFNIYLDNAIRTWKMDASCGFEPNYLSTILYSNDQIILSRSENTKEISILCFWQNHK